ncbi:MAG: hypothetical protein KA604_03265 [Candidatus Saccharimonas sp.]|nr:hypothetical protein [Candidatus Saccharimonas sp.]
MFEDLRGTMRDYGDNRGTIDRVESTWDRISEVFDGLTPWLIAAPLLGLLLVWLLPFAIWFVLWAAIGIAIGAWLYSIPKESDIGAFFILLGWCVLWLIMTTIVWWIGLH